MKLRSMTGYARASGQFGEVRLEVELKSVNHRFLDISARVPGIYSEFEQDILKCVREKLGRGRVEVTVSRNDAAQPSFEMRYNSALFSAYWDAIKEASASVAVELGNVAPSAVLQILSRKEVLDLTSVRSDIVDERAALLQTVDQALVGLVQMRKEEGASLEKDILEQLKALETITEEIAEKIPLAVSEAQARLKVRIEKLAAGVEVDPNRMAQEIAILADRADVSEEITRLRSHLQQFRRYLNSDQGGKKLEFLLQEIGRELNTTGSKIQNAVIQTSVVEGKSCAERIREQLLNVE